MFIIKKLVINNEGKELLNVCLSGNDLDRSAGSYTTLVLGENGVGKSFLLKSIIDVFLFLENAKNYKRKPKYQYESFQIEYKLNGSEYSIRRESGSIIIASKYGEEIDYKDIELPNKILALAFMVNDKFPWNKDNEGNMYVYHGVRSSTNSTYTSSLISGITIDLLTCIAKEHFSQVAEILRILKFDSKVSFNWRVNGIKEQTLDLTSCKKCEFPDYDNKNYPKVYFYKDGERMPFEDCSSGEKHLLFAFLGILRRIEDNCLILIDEPEISLHPDWQMRYISSLRKLFSRYRNCCYILASHSHYFVSELQADSSSIIVLRKDDNGPSAEIIPYDTYSWSAENIIYNVFGIRTARNYYFECDLSDLINRLEAFDCSNEQRESIRDRINKLQKYVFDIHDPLQKLLDEAEERIQC